MQRFFSFLMLSLFFTASCAQEKTYEIDLFSAPKNPKTCIIKVEPLDADKNYDHCYSDIYSKVDYIRLETCIDSDIRHISKMEITEDEDLIVFDRQRGTVIRFNKDGKYLNHIGYKGHGPKEFIQPTDIAYDSFNKQVIINDKAKKSLLCYDLNGEFVNKIHLGYRCDAIGVIDASTLGIYLDYGASLKDGEKEYNFKIIDRKGNLLGQAVPFSNRMIHFHPVSNITFFQNNGKMYCNEYLSPLVFTMTQNGVEPIYYVDFGNKKITQKKFEENAAKKSSITHDWQNKTSHFTSFCEVNGKIFMECTQNGLVITHLIDKKNPKNHFIAKRMTNDVNGIMTSGKFLKTLNGKLYFRGNPTLMERWRDNGTLQKAIESYPEKDQKLLLEMLDYPNPIIQVCTLK